jgi:hypothetical protein
MNYVHNILRILILMSECLKTNTFLGALCGI